MKIDNKYFVPFILVVAVAAALLIAFFTVSSQKSQRQSFERRIMAQDSLKMEKMKVIGSEDSISVNNYPGRYVILDFWATWSNYSEEIHRSLADLVEENSELVIIAAVVQDKREKVREYIELNNFPFTYVNGTRVFNSYYVPGIPVQLIYNKESEIIEVNFGSVDSTQFDSLRTLMNNGK